MTDTMTPDPTTPRLERPLQGRIVTGVCAGLARHFGVDVTLVRIVLVVAAFLGGAGVILYAAATLLVPEQGQRLPLIKGGPRRGRALLVLGALLVAIGAVNLLGDIGIGGHTLWGAVMLSIGAFLLLRAQEGRPGLAGAGQGARAADEPPPTTPAPDRATGPATAAVPRRRTWAPTLITLGAVLLAAATAIALVTALADGAEWTAVAGAAVLAAGIGLAAGSLLGASPLIVAPVLLATAAAMAVQASDVELSGGVGDRSYRPATAGDLRDRYRLGIGELEIDLRDTALPRGRTVIRAKVGVGHLSVRAPRDATVRVVGHAGAGEIRLLGERHDGTSVDATASRSGPRARTVLIDASVGFGAIDVVPADSAFPDDDHDHDWSRR